VKPKSPRRSVALCFFCSQPVRWAFRPDRTKKMMVDFDSVQDGPIVLLGQPPTVAYLTDEQLADGQFRYRFRAHDRRVCPKWPERYGVSRPEVHA